MQYNRVVALSNGTCIKIDNSLSSSVKSITFELEKDKKYEDHISVFNEREMVIDGIAYSDNNRVVLKNNTLNDKSCDLVFNINTVDLNDGDLIEGTISIISNVGAMTIPYKYSIVTSTLSRLASTLNSITDFYDALNENFDNAIQLFSDSEFKKSPFVQDEFTLSLYEGLIKGSNLDIAMIEFFKAFEIDISNFYEKIDDSIVRHYIDDTLDKLDISDFTNRKNANDILSLNGNLGGEKVNDDTLDEASQIVENIRDKELLNVLASFCVRNNYVDEIAFKIYSKVIEKGSNIIGIYDKFILSIPDDYARKLPLYIYRYYFDDKSYSFDDKTKLYENIIAAFDENEDVFHMYNTEILEYAVSRIYQNRITESLVKIYNKVLSKSIVNENNCNNILYLLRNHRIAIKNNLIKKVIIKYNETEKETKYDVHNGIAYVPIFFGSNIILFEDSYGNRFYRENAEIQVLFERKDLESYIIDNFPQKDIIDMTKIIKLNESDKIYKEYEVDEIRELEAKLKINPVIKEKFKTKIIDFYFNQVINGNSISENTIVFLSKLNFGKMDKYDKRKMLKIMIENNNYKYVYEKVSIFGLDLMEDNDLIQLFSKCIDANDDAVKDRLMNDILAFLKKGANDYKLSTFLSNNYEGSIENMLFILNSLNSVNGNPSTISKKLLMACLESNYNDNIDYVFDNYSLDSGDNKDLVVAYLNKKATDYVLDNVETSDEYFEKLSKYMSENYDNIDNLPVIFLLAITKYISTLNILSNNELRRILIKSMERLLRLEFAFSYFKKLNKHMKMPYYIMNKEYIEYHADKDFVPKVILSISGDDEKKEAELTKMFMNIYVKKITVFKNEIINYEIINSNDPTLGILDKGVLTYDENYEFEYPQNSKIRSAYDYINDAIVCLDRDNIEGLKKVVMNLVEKQEISKELFNI